MMPAGVAGRAVSANRGEAYAHVEACVYTSLRIQESLAGRLSDAQVCRVEVDMSKMIDTRRYPRPHSLLPSAQDTLC